MAMYIVTGADACAIPEVAKLISQKDPLLTLPEIKLAGHRVRSAREGRAVSRWRWSSTKFPVMLRCVMFRPAFDIREEDHEATNILA